jgi:hypothetical protein
MRYAGLPPAELEAYRRLLVRSAASLLQQARRMEQAQVTGVLGGPCAHALLTAVRSLVLEIRALAGEIQTQAGQVAQDPLVAQGGAQGAQDPLP